jgi:hypothetical protein
MVSFADINSREDINVQEWKLIKDLDVRKGQMVLVCHDDKRWIRFGRQFQGLGEQWYYSGTNERSQWAETKGDAPTHWMLLPELPPHAANCSCAAKA